MQQRDDDAQFEELFNRLRAWAPAASGFIDWVRRPSARLVRIPLGIFLVIGGIFSILPILGLWMLPLGLLILALDIKILRRPVTRAVLWIETKWEAWRAWRARRRQP